MKGSFDPQENRWHRGSEKPANLCAWSLGRQARRVTTPSVSSGSGKGNSDMDESYETVREGEPSSALRDR
ncbi:hypothetical protein GCM10011588_67660 [Nocardia jinanensis]|uniref:Uncharacterized protein n=1 Tax=Nocardia jinanensis TaxID=382504 RepID=A0A917RYU7_9NOCA|nr:hypothetical protein GCM10011588_67660 [Nocardia jinanensis]